MSKIQFMVMIDPPEAARVDALRIVMDISRAEVIRRAITDVHGPLSRMEVQEAGRLDRLRTLADRHNLPLPDFVREVIEQSGKHAPTLEALEALLAEATGERRPEPLPVVTA